MLSLYLLCCFQKEGGVLAVDSAHGLELIRGALGTSAPESPPHVCLFRFGKEKKHGHHGTGRRPMFDDMMTEAERTEELLQWSCVPRMSANHLK
ncbi:hypothetical protein MRX96_058185 [Rhipicephalus microplus]